MDNGPLQAELGGSAEWTSVPWPSSRRAWLGVVLLMLAYAFAYIDRSVLSLVVEPIKLSLNLSDTEIGLLQGVAFGLLFTLAAVPVGWLADAVSRTRLVATGIAFWSVMTAACGLSTSFGQLFVARMGVALGEASLSPTAPSLIADSFPPHRRTLPLSLYVTAGGAGTSIAFIAGGLVASLLRDGTTVDLPGLGAVASWQVIWFIVSAPGLLVSALFLLLPEPVRRSTGQPDPTLQELRRVLASRRSILIPQAAGICLFQLQALAYGAWAPAFFMRRYGWNIAAAGIRLGLSQLIMGILGGIAAGWTARILLRRGLRDANLVTSAIFLGGMAPFAIAGFLVSNAWLSFAFLGVMTMFAHGPVGGSLASIQETVPNRLRGRVTAIYYASVGLVGMTFGPLIIGLMNNYLFGEKMIGLSLAIVSVFTLPLGALLLVVAGRYRRVLAWVE